jgi:hypothetical protein
MLLFVCFSGDMRPIGEGSGSTEGAPGVEVVGFFAGEGRISLARLLDLDFDLFLFLENL